MLSCSLVGGEPVFEVGGLDDPLGNPDTCLTQAVQEFAKTGCTVGYAKLNPKRLKAGATRERVFLHSIDGDAYEMQHGETLGDRLSGMPAWASELENVCTLNIDLDADILLPDGDSLLAKAAGELKFHKENSMTEPPKALKRKRCPKNKAGAKRRRVSVEEEGESANEDESDEDDANAADVGDDQPAREYQDWVYLHQKYWNALYDKLGMTEQRWTMPSLNPLYKLYEDNRWYTSLPARYQDIVLYWHLKAPLEPPQNATYSDVKEIFVDLPA